MNVNDSQDSVPLVKPNSSQPERIHDGRLNEKTRSFLKQPSRKKLVVEKDEKTGKSDDSTKLNCWLATGICGNNITSSCLYVIALCAVPAGKYAPIALTFIAGLLYLFRGIYTEVVEALPVNGGTYNLLLNTTTKGKASIAACLTMLSYVTTAVISSTAGMSYIQTMFADPEDFDLIMWTIICLSVAAMLNLAGIGESAIVSLVIFIFHMLSIAILIILGFVRAFSDMPIVDVSTGELATGAVNATVETMPVLFYNWRYTSPPDGIFLGTFFGYANALLGISGFESSSNYVEQQAPGVFPKTLRNMWIAVTLINPLTALLAQCLLPINAIAAEAETGALLSSIASSASGGWLKTIIVVDGALVLIGAVIVAFVGFNGLTHRMTLDRCLPQFLLGTNKCRGTRHWIICGFWFLTSLLVLFTQGNVDVMAGIYTMAFLTVMILFTIGNMLIKLRRATLPTPQRVPFPVVVLAFVMMSAGLLGNLLSRDVKSLLGFIYFGACFFLPVQIMLNRVFLMRVLAAMFRTCIKDGETPNTGCCMKNIISMIGPCVEKNIYRPLTCEIERLQQKPLIFFTRSNEPSVLLQAIQYFLANESRRWFKFVQIFETTEKVPSVNPPIYNALRELFPDVTIDFCVQIGTFNPEMVQRISAYFKVPSSFMFMSSFGDKMKFSFMELGGLRLITLNVQSKEKMYRIVDDKEPQNQPDTVNGDQPETNGDQNETHDNKSKSKT